MFTFWSLPDFYEGQGRYGQHKEILSSFYIISNRRLARAFLSYFGIFTSHNFFVVVFKPFTTLCLCCDILI